MNKLYTVLLWIALPLLAEAQEIPGKLKQPEICFETTCIDFGRIEWGAPGIFTYKFTNCGNEVLILQSGQSSCGCLICQWPKDPVYPGKSAVVKLQYDTKRIGPTTKTATIISNAAKEPVILLRIKGTVLPYPTAIIADSTIDFGMVKVGDQLHFDLTYAGYQYHYDTKDSLKIMKIEQVSGTITDLTSACKALGKEAFTELSFSVPKQKKGTFTFCWKVYFNDGRDPVLLTATGKISR